MPTYQYLCTACERPLEAQQSFSDDPLTECPTCGGRLRKVFSAVGVVFKGSGFYRTDSRVSSSNGADGGGGDAGGDQGADKRGDKGADKGGDKAADKGAGQGDKTAAKSAEAPVTKKSSASDPAA